MAWQRDSCPSHRANITKSNDALHRAVQCTVLSEQHISTSFPAEPVCSIREKLHSKVRLICLLHRILQLEPQATVYGPIVKPIVLDCPTASVWLLQTRLRYVLVIAPVYFAAHCNLSGPS